MKTAIFSNGFQDTYKGKRDVRAAWCMINKKTGAVMASGHSLDRERAQKTAESHLRDFLKAECGHYIWLPQRRLSVNEVSGFAASASGELLRKEGLLPDRATSDRIREAVTAHNAVVKACKLAAVTIEIIEF